MILLQSSFSRFDVEINCNARELLAASCVIIPLNTDVGPDFAPVDNLGGRIAIAS
jgi:hypothetical protein